MVSKRSVKEQLDKIGFKHTGWGRAEVSELPNILLPDEEIYEVVNGFYEGGFALLVSTDVRLLLIDKKPLKYLTVEDLRFDMINEMDYSHRFFGANISIATGNKILKFTSLNQPRLRKLISHVQHCMADAKKVQNVHAEDQKSHLEQINQQLQAYLMAQHQHQLRLEEAQRAQAAGIAPPPIPEPAKPSNELSDYLFAQSLLAQYQAQTGQKIEPVQPAISAVDASVPVGPQPDDLYNEGLKEVFGKKEEPVQTGTTSMLLDPARIAYSKLPMALRNKKIGRPRFHSATKNPSPPQPAEL